MLLKMAINWRRNTEMTNWVEKQMKKCRLSSKCRKACILRQTIAAAESTISLQPAQNVNPFLQSAITCFGIQKNAMENKQSNLQSTISQLRAQNVNPSTRSATTCYGTWRSAKAKKLIEVGRGWLFLDSHAYSTFSVILFSFFFCIHKYFFAFGFLPFYTFL